MEKLETDEKSKSRETPGDTLLVIVRHKVPKQSSEVRF